MAIVMISTAAADGLELLGARVSVGTDMTTSGLIFLREHHLNLDVYVCSNAICPLKFRLEY